MSPSINEIRERTRPNSLRSTGVTRAATFGSHAKDTEEIDILVRIEEDISLLEFMGLKQDLADTLGVDIVEYGALKPSPREKILEALV